MKIDFSFTRRKPEEAPVKRAFSFAPGETNGAEIVNAPFAVEVDGHEFLLVVADTFVRFCDGSSPRAASEPEQWNFALAEPLRVSNRTQVNPNFVRSLFQDHWKRGQFGRIVFSGEAPVFLGRDGHGFVFTDSYPWSQKRPSLFTGTPVPFRFGFEGEFESFPASFWPAQMEAWHAEENSDFHFALELAQRDEKGVARLVSDIRGGWPFMERIAHLLLETDLAWSSPPYADFGLVGVRVAMKRYETPTLRLVCTEYDWDSGEDNAFHQPGALWGVWLREFVRGFDEDILFRHSAGDLVQDCSFVISDELRERSAHERLEALLLLRDWLRDKLPRDEIEALLR